MSQKVSIQRPEGGQWYWVWITPVQHITEALHKGYTGTVQGLKGPYRSDVYVQKLPTAEELIFHHCDALFKKRCSICFLSVLINEMFREKHSMRQTELSLQLWDLRAFWTNSPGSLFTAGENCSSSYHRSTHTDTHTHTGTAESRFICRCWFISMTTHTCCEWHPQGRERARQLSHQPEDDWTVYWFLGQPFHQSGNR